MDREVCPWCESVFITEGVMCVDCAKFIADYKNFKSRVIQGYLQVDPWEVRSSDEISNQVSPDR